MKKILLIALVILLTLFAGFAQADVYLEQVSSSKKNSDETTQSKIYISENAIRIEEPNGEMVSITDFETQQLITLDMENREYFVFPLQQVREDIGRGAERLRDSVQMNWRIETVGPAEEIAGYQTTKFIFHGRGSANSAQVQDQIAITLEFWIGQQVPVPASINARILDALGIDQNPFIDPAIVTELKNIGGYPLRTITSIQMSNIDDVIRQEVILLSEVDHNPQWYTVPAGFKQVDPQTQPTQ